MAKRQLAPKTDHHAHSDNLQSRLGAVVRTCRRQLGITQEELAWRANMHRTYIADIERGARNVTLRSVTNLAKALQVSVGSLFTYVTGATGLGTPTAPGTPENLVLDILLVEDSATDAAVTQRALKHARVTNRLRVVQDAETALDCLLGTGRYAKRKPDLPGLIVLDLNLPRMSGVEFLRHIKVKPALASIPVVILTVSRTDRAIMECSRLGVENYIIKPLDIEGLIGVIPKLNLQLTLGPVAEVKSDR